MSTVYLAPTYFTFDYLVTSSDIAHARYYLEFKQSYKNLVLWVYSYRYLSMFYNFKVDVPVKLLGQLISLFLTDKALTQELAKYTVTPYHYPVKILNRDLYKLPKQRISITTDIINSVIRALGIRVNAKGLLNQTMSFIPMNIKAIKVCELLQIAIVKYPKLASRLTKLLTRYLTGNFSSFYLPNCLAVEFFGYQRYKSNSILLCNKSQCHISTIQRYMPCPRLITEEVAFLELVWNRTSCTDCGTDNPLPADPKYSCTDYSQFIQELQVVL